MNKDIFDKAYERLEGLEKAYPRVFNVIGHIIVISSFIGVIIAFYYAITH